jgi:hypothetical protein
MVPLDKNIVPILRDLYPHLNDEQLLLRWHEPDTSCRAHCG